MTTGNPTQWRIDVIKVPLRHPEDAAIVSQPRIFTDPATGAFNGLQNTLRPARTACTRPGTPYSPLPNTNTCHDVTSFPARELVAGACQGNGILLSTKDPTKPKRLDAVSDPNFSYWHSATFNNDGTKVMFTDEWGGGTSPRCRDTDLPEWGADALFDISKNKEMEFGSYFKMPAVQTVQENCVAHNSSIVPVPGRDILVQAWYQGGLSVIDFSDTANPVEIAYFDRGPINVPNPTGLNLGGLWSTYWYNGQVYGTEIARGFDTFGLVPSEFLSEDEIAAASEVEAAPVQLPAPVPSSRGGRASRWSAPTSTRRSGPEHCPAARSTRSRTPSRTPSGSPTGARTGRLPRSSRTAPATSAVRATRASSSDAMLDLAKELR